MDASPPAQTAPLAARQAGSRGRQVATVMAILVFVVVGYATTNVRLEVDGEYFASRALQAIPFADAAAQCAPRRRLFACRRADLHDAAQPPST